MQTTEIKREIAMEVYGDSGSWVIEIGKRNHTINLQVVRRYRLDADGWHIVSTSLDRIR